MSHRRRLKSVRYVCHDCVLRFVLYLPAAPKKKPVCPLCADNIEVRPDDTVESYDIRVKPGNEGTVQRWTEEEEQKLIELYNAKKLPIFEIAKVIGRKYSATRSKCGHLRKRGLIK